MTSTFRSLLTGLLFSVTLLLPLAGWAQGVYWDLETLLVDFFPDAERVTYAEVTLTDTEVSTIAARAGVTPRLSWTVFIALAGGEVTGYAIVDEELGQHELITYAVRCDPEGHMTRVEVMAYREAYGEEVRDERFLRQFDGLDAESAVRVGHDVVAISGATISSVALATGTRRVVHVLAAIRGRGDDSLLAQR